MIPGILIRGEFMDLNEIEYFLALAVFGNISRAAEHLYISQSALSQFLTKSEKKLGVKLFDRDHTGLTLTDAGHTYYDAAVRIEEIRRSALQSIDYHKRINHGVIRFGINGYRSVNQIANLMPALNENFPELEIEMKQGSVAELCKELDEHTVDYSFFAIGDVSSKYPHILTSEDELILVVSDPEKESDEITTPRVHEEPVDIRDFQDYGFIMYNGATEVGTLTNKYFNDIGFFPTVLAYVDDFLLAKEVLNRFRSAYIISRNYIERLNNCDIYRLKDAPMYKLGMVYRDNPHNLKFHKWLLDYISGGNNK